MKAIWQSSKLWVPGLMAFAAWQLSTQAQPAANGTAILAKPGTRFSIEVVESFDAKYDGDTPGHTGRAGGLEAIRPHVALGDSVYRGEEKIGTVTSVVWSRAQGSLTIEFDPAPMQRIAVGDNVWVDLNPVSHAKKTD